MVRYTLILLLFCCEGSFATDWHLELGLGYHHKQNYSHGSKDTDFVDNPLGIIDLYIQHKKYKVGWLHTSSIPDRDWHYGYNVLYIKRRMW